MGNWFLVQEGGISIAQLIKTEKVEKIWNWNTKKEIVEDYYDEKKYEAAL